MAKSLNVGIIGDLNNWIEVSPWSQFLAVDEFGPRNRLTIDKLKQLTSGNAAIFRGNRKSYGSSFEPRADVQLIMTSNYHLFDALGSKSSDGIRKVTPEEAAILQDRFNIIKLDEGEHPMTSEAYDALKHTEGNDYSQYVKRHSNRLFSLSKARTEDDDDE